MCASIVTKSEPKVLPVQVADIAGGSFPAVVQILAGMPECSIALIVHQVLKSYYPILRFFFFAVSHFESSKDRQRLRD
jgi:hypothetical protein